MAASSSETGKYAALSRYCIRKADEYLRAGDRGQASEKGWGAVAVARVGLFGVLCGFGAGFAAVYRWLGAPFGGEAAHGAVGGVVQPQQVADYSLVE